ncbi:MAG: hypothetical protein QOF18_2989 [Frankiaceae bacterium]|nr:hypothetical protein [Frankiaceae bacterium]
MGELADVIAVATGAEHRPDPVTPTTGGPAGNALLTACTGLLLLALFLAESVTLISVRSMISWHIVIGTLLVPLALLKTATTGWRIVRYYTGNAAYRQAGPPPLILRVLGPIVILTALAVLGSGLALIAVGNSAHDNLATIVGFRVDAITVHQASFIAWLAAVGVHTLLRTVPAIRIAGHAGAPRGGVPGGLARLGLIAVTLIAGGVVSGIVLNLSGAWT